MFAVLKYKCSRKSVLLFLFLARAVDQLDRLAFTSRRQMLNTYHRNNVQHDSPTNKPISSGTIQ